MSGMDALSNDVSVEEFLGHYEPWMAASWRDSFGDSLLCRALMNHDPTTRVVLANRLLDDGANPAASVGDDGGTMAHVLLTRIEHDPVVEAPLSAGCIVHSDRGSQFRARKFVHALNRHHHSKIHERYMNKEISTEEFLEEYHDSANYEVQDPRRNRAHDDE